METALISSLSLSLSVCICLYACVCASVCVLGKEVEWGGLESPQILSYLPLYRVFGWELLLKWGTL